MISWFHFTYEVIPEVTDDIMPPETRAFVHSQTVLVDMQRLGLAVRPVGVLHAVVRPVDPLPLVLYGYITAADVVTCV